MTETGHIEHDGGTNQLRVNVFHTAGTQSSISVIFLAIFLLLAY